MVYVRRNMTEEERAKMREFAKEVREKNKSRSEDDIKILWKLRNEAVRKWWFNGRE